MPAELIDADGRLPLPWLAAPLVRALGAARGHALLLCAAPGLGARALALGLAQSRLCEAPGAEGVACGRCAGCRLVQARAHPDLLVLLPENERRETGWLLADDKPEGDDARRKPSRQIRIDDVRGGLDWIHKTAARGRGKMVVLHPAEALNPHAASALLKTLEEPPAGTRLVITCSDPMHLLPTVRSRCQQLVVPPPEAAVAEAWLAGQGIADAGVLLAACDGRPLDVLDWRQRGIDAARWAALPSQLVAGRPGVLAGASVPQAVELLLKVCHDALAVAAGGGGRYFAAMQMPGGLSLPALAAWRDELLRLARTAEHPWSEALAVDALVAGACRALGGGADERGSAAREPGGPHARDGRAPTSPRRAS
ncbi:MAG: DNA polymerase III subunit delta' [Rubrivivax sp.]|nr:DNA polymerase III subunit delta' [Rubrivivax sp.]